VTLGFDVGDKVFRRKRTRDHGSKFRAPSAADGTLREKSLVPLLFEAAVGKQRRHSACSGSALLILLPLPLPLSLSLSLFSPKISSPRWLLFLSSSRLLYFLRFTHTHTRTASLRRKRQPTPTPKFKLSRTTSVSTGTRRWVSFAVELVRRLQRLGSGTRASSSSLRRGTTSSVRVHAGTARVRLGAMSKLFSLVNSARHERVRSARCARARGLTSARYQHTTERMSLERNILGIAPRARSRARRSRGLSAEDAASRRAFRYPLRRSAKSLGPLSCSLHIRHDAARRPASIHCFAHNRSSPMMSLTENTLHFPVHDTVLGYQARESHNDARRRR